MTQLIKLKNCRRIFFKDNRIKLINGENKGCCEARNLGINNSKGDIIIFMTADSFFLSI